MANPKRRFPSLISLIIVANPLFGGSNWTETGLARAIVLQWGNRITTCTSNPLVAAAWRRLPSDQRFPCDAEHVVLVPDFARFLESHADIAARPDLREKARHAFAFSISATWPIYINLDSHRPLVNAFLTSRPWIAFAIAGVLAHERVHATGTLSESAGLFAEYELDRRFSEQGKLPREFDLQALKAQYRNALNQGQ